MTSLIQNDATGKAIASKDSVKVQMFVRGTGLHKDFDISMTEARQLLGLKGIRKLDFYKLQKDANGNWQRLVVEDPEQKKVDDDGDADE